MTTIKTKITFASVLLFFALIFSTIFLASMLNESANLSNLQETKDSLNAAITKVYYLACFIGIVFFIFIYIVFIAVLKPFFAFKSGINELLDFITRKRETISHINYSGTDEFGLLIQSINDYAISFEESLARTAHILQETSQVISTIKEGKLTNRIKSTACNPDLNTLIQSINDMLSILESKIGKDYTAVLGLIQLYTQMDFRLSCPNPTGTLEREVNGMKHNFSSMFSTNLNYAKNLDELTTNLTKSFQQFHSASGKQNLSLEQTAASIEEVSGNIRSSSDKISELSLIAKSALSVANEGKELVKLNNNTMNKINDSAIIIRDSLTSIEQIAFQTNILSLNAAVEAATAGEHGKGFAVVAAEVRNLASKSAEAAKTINDLVNDTTTKSAEGIALSATIENSFGSLFSKVSDTLSLAEEIFSNSKEQLSAINQISVAAHELDGLSHSNSMIIENAQNINIKIDSISKMIVADISEKKF